MDDTNFNFTSVKGKAEKSFQFKDVFLDTARTKQKPEKFDLAGRFIYIGLQAYDDEFTLSSTRLTGVALVSFNEPFSTPIEIEAGRVYKIPEGFESVYVRNTAQTNKMLRLYSSVNAEVIPFKSQLEIITAAGTDRNSIADVAVAATTTVQILAANPNRKNWTASNLVANGTVVRIGDSSTGAARGNEVGIGGNASDTDTDAVYVYNPSASSINIGVTEVE